MNQMQNIVIWLGSLTLQANSAYGTLSAFKTSTVFTIQSNVTLWVCFASWTGVLPRLLHVLLNWHKLVIIITFKVICMCLQKEAIKVVSISAFLAICPRDND